MASKTKRGVVLSLILAAVLAGTTGGAEIVDRVTDFLDGVSVIGEGDSALLVKSSEEDRLKNCKPEAIIANKDCEGLRVVIFDARKMPFITRNVREAWADGLPALLTTNRAMDDANRKASCGKFVKQYPEGSCDEYPMASTSEGGAGARIDEVPERENQCQGGTVRWWYPPQDGVNFIVVIWHPDLIADGPYEGIDLAKERQCGI